METKEQWLERIRGDLTMGGKLSKDSYTYRAMMKEIDSYWDIQQTLYAALEESETTDVFILSEN